TLDKVDLSGVDLRIHVHGPYAFSGFVGNSGRSLLALPSFAASLTRSVQVALDDPSLAQAVTARIDSTGSGWSVALPTPAVGKHTLYAQSHQGFASSAVVAQQFNVTK